MHQAGCPWAIDNRCTLIGGDLGDIIAGGAGNDILIPWSGDDILTGGTGHDTFVFGPGSGRNIITDMTIGSWEQDSNADLIVIEGYSFEQATFGQNEEGHLRIILGESDWIDLNGISHTTQLTNHNLIFTGGVIGV